MEIRQVLPIQASKPTFYPPLLSRVRIKTAFTHQLPIENRDVNEKEEHPQKQQEQSRTYVSQNYPGLN